MNLGKASDCLIRTSPDVVGQRGSDPEVSAGYARVVLALLSFYLMPSSPWPAVFCYLLSALLDAFDGHAARALDQGTRRLRELARIPSVTSDLWLVCFQPPSLAP